MLCYILFLIISCLFSVQGNFLNELLLKLFTVEFIYQAKTKEECRKQIHLGCTNTYQATDEEVEKARIYIQENMMKKASYPPSLPPCPKLYVRRNFKCLTHEERVRVIEVIQKLYEKGFMWELAEIHAKCWVPWHKSVEALNGHRWLAHKLEMAMIEIDPDVTLPYWV